MPERAPHPRDEWAEFRAAGEGTPRLFLVTDGREVELAELREMYAVGWLTIDELNASVESVLRGGTVPRSVLGETA
jgi:hypothetical protein